MMLVLSLSLNSQIEFILLKGLGVSSSGVANLVSEGFSLDQRGTGYIRGCAKIRKTIAKGIQTTPLCYTTS